MKTDKTREQIIERLKQKGRDVASQIDASKNPKIDVPLRTLANVYFDEKDRLIKLGAKTKSRLFFNVGQAKRFMQTMLVMAQLSKLLEQNQPALDTRQIFYTLRRTIEGTKENTFEEQTESDDCIEDIEVTINTLREQLNIVAMPKGVIGGPLTVKDLVTGDVLDYTKMGTAGGAVPANVEPDVIEFKDCSADYILVVEKHAVWNLLNQQKFWKTNNCILLTGKGQPARAERRLVSRMASELNLPVYVFADMDVYGYYIYSVYKQGSINLAFFSEKAASPKARYVGLVTKDIKKYKIEKTNWWKLEDEDYKRLKEVRGYEWFKHKDWQEELRALEDFAYKVESDALVSKKIDFTANTYLPEKISTKDFLP